MRTSTERIAGDCATYWKPTRIAPKKRSPGSTLGLGSERQLMITNPAASDSTALSRKT